MKNLFNQEDLGTLIEQYKDVPPDLVLRTYTSRLLGADKNLVLHGGGNTSVKLKIENIFGETDDVIFVKGSGHDMAAMEPDGFTGLYLGPLQKLLQLRSISDTEMDRQLKINKTHGHSPDPSVETLFHAFLPHKFIDHTHANSILALTNQKNGPELIREALGSGIAVLPYIKSGLPLALEAFGAYRKNPDLEAIVILHHGIFTFAQEAAVAYDNMVKYVNMADAYIASREKKRETKPPGPRTQSIETSEPLAAKLANLIRGACSHEVSNHHLYRYYVTLRNSRPVLEISLSDKAPSFCQTGVLTPDHVIQTKNQMVYIDPVSGDEDELKHTVLESVKAFKKNYQQYFDAKVKEMPVKPDRLDPYPRLFLVAGVGLFALGGSRQEAEIAADIGEHTLLTKKRARVLGPYHPISESHVFDMEHWRMQQKKIRPQAAPLQGQVAVVTGGGGAIGFGIADRLLDAGACVVLTDIDRNRVEKSAGILVEKYDPARVGAKVFDVTHYLQVEKIFDTISLEFGGIDIVVPNAGIAHVATIEDLEPSKLDQVLAVNLTGTFTVIKAAIPIFKRQNTGGNIVLISSKNVFDPGAAFGAYSASKAGAHQIAKIAAIELAELDVRVNMVNPDAVFGDEQVCSGLWETIGPDRMKSRGLDPEGLQEYYCQRSLLKTQVLAEHVGNAVVFFAANLTPTTGAALPVDAGNPSTFSR